LQICCTALCWLMALCVEFAGRRISEAIGAKRTCCELLPCGVPPGTTVMSRGFPRHDGFRVRATASSRARDVTVRDRADVATGVLHASVQTQQRRRTLVAEDCARRHRRQAQQRDQYGPKIKARLTDLGGTALTGLPADFGRLIADETEKWARV